MQVGRYKNYFWIEWHSLSLPELLGCVPDIVVGRYLVNTSFDSGKLSLCDEDRERGWWSAGALTYSPKMIDPDIPNDQFDEWLVFAKPTEVESWKPFVNDSEFSLVKTNSVTDGLWSCLERMRPESFLADGDRMIFVTRDQHLHETAAAHKDLKDEM